MLQIEQQGNQVVFQGELNCETVVTHWPFKLMPQLPQDVTFNLSQVAHVDTAGLAWLLHQVAAASQRKLNLKMVHPPAQLMRLAQVSDVVGLLPVLEL